MPVMYMMCGLPGSGKTTRAKEIEKERKKYNIKIFSSDELRKELYGDENIQKDNQKLFQILFKRMRKHLESGGDIIYDATNLNKKQRIAFLEYIKYIPDVIKICEIMSVPFEECLARNNMRTRHVPEEVIENMYKKWTPPHYSEGFDVINIIMSGDIEHYTINNFLDISRDFDQGNEHHSLSLGDHCQKAANIIKEKFPENKDLYYAAILHDNGKIFTKSKLNIKGEDDGNYHYYNHNNCGAYDSMFYMVNEFKNKDDIEEELNIGPRIIEIANIIYYHMHPYLGWKQSEKARNRDVSLLGEALYNLIIEIHNADVNAH